MLPHRRRNDLPRLTKRDSLSDIGADMIEFEELEREYRELSARIVYALLRGEDVSSADMRRWEELGEMRVKYSAPDFSSLISEAA